ncbi:MAG TPA: tetratricopeptide repeat protein [Candidatus Wildermuthbacteria bacterium]|nr:tetratricopeptide repeat protein [Candidatus Wildermuthbacteria bacterium]
MKLSFQSIASEGALGNLSKVALYTLAFLIPLWVLPFTQNMIAYQKQTLLVVFVILALIAWLAKAMNQGEFSIRLSWLHIPVGVLIGVVGISAVFSRWSYASFWGFPLDVSESFITVLAFGILYLLISNTIEDAKHLVKFFFLFVLSGVLAGIVALLQLKGIFLPFGFAASTAFNTIGSPNSIAVIASVLLPLALVLAFVSRLLQRWFLWLVVFILFVVIVFINFATAWITLMGGLLVLLAFGMLNMRKKAEFGWISFPMVFIVLSLFFLIFRVSIPGAPVVPVEVSPSQSGEFEIVREVISKSPILGSGPGTFVLDYASYHSPLLNQTVFWGTRFGSGASEVLDWTATKGILGLLSLLSLIGMGLYVSIRYLLRFGVEDNKKESSPEQHFSWMVGLGLLASFSALTLSQFLYPSNFVMWFLFWALLGGLVVVTSKTTKKFSVAPPSLLAPALSFVFLLVLIFGLGLFFIGGQKYAAEVQYLKGVVASSQGDLDGAIAKAVSAVRLNGSIDIYWRDLSQLYLARVNEISTREGLSDEDKQQLQITAASNSIASAQRAVQVAPENVANWNVQGFIYRNFIGLEGAESFAIASYERVAELEPASPFSYTELGRVYVLQAQRLADSAEFEGQKEEALDKALESLQKAIDLKADYSAAHFLIAAVYEQRGESAEAIAKLEEARDISPNDLELAFQLAVMYRQQDQLTKAQEELERAKRINPNHSNTRYLLGLVYDDKGDTGKAVTEFEAVSQLNPGNAQLEQILSNLRAGNSALEGISTVQAPIEETPPEIEEIEEE